MYWAYLERIRTVVQLRVPSANSREIPHISCSYPGRAYLSDFLTKIDESPDNLRIRIPILSLCAREFPESLRF